jgi:hypothetical protein
MSTDLTISKQGSYLTQTRKLRISLETGIAGVLKWSFNILG